MKRKETFVSYTLEDVRDAVKGALCWSDVCRSVGVSICTFNFKRLQRLCTQNNITTNHFDVQRSFRRGKREWTAEELFVKNCSIGRSQLRQVLVRLGFYPGRCDECGIAEWNKKPLTIEIDHVNGNHTDNRKENLRWLCPNCHSQTPTYRSRSKATNNR